MKKLKAQEPVPIDPNCPFCIAAKEKDQRKLFQNNLCFVYLASHPATPGNILVIPNNHAHTIQQLTLSEQNKLFNNALIFAEQLLKKLGTEAYMLKYNNQVYTVEPQETRHVSHIHFHIIPRYSPEDKIWEKPNKADEDYFSKYIKLLEGVFRA